MVAVPSKHLLEESSREKPGFWAQVFTRELALQDKPGAKDIVPGKCSIEFRSASFSYVADAPVIKDISFTCPGGKTLAFVGATGLFLETCSAELCLVVRYLLELRCAAHEMLDCPHTSMRAGLCGRHRSALGKLLS